MAIINFGKAAFRKVENYAKGYSGTEVKVREAASNDPWGPSGTQMHEIAQLTFTNNDFVEIMDMLDKCLNEKGKNWRQVFKNTIKSLVDIDYCLHSGSENVVSYFRDNLYLISALREFQYIDSDGRDQGEHVRRKATDVVILLKDEDRLRKARKAWTKRQDQITNDRQAVVVEADEQSEHSITTEYDADFMQQQLHLQHARSVTPPPFTPSADFIAIQQQFDFQDGSVVPPPFKQDADFASMQQQLSLQHAWPHSVTPPPVTTRSQSQFATPGLPPATFRHLDSRQEEQNLPQLASSFFGPLPYTPRIVSQRSKPPSQLSSSNPFRQMGYNVPSAERMQQQNIQSQQHAAHRLAREAGTASTGVEAIANLSISKPHHTQEELDRVVRVDSGSENDSASLLHPPVSRALGQTPGIGPFLSEAIPSHFATNTPQPQSNKALTLLETILNEPGHYQRLLKCSPSDARIILELCQVLLDSSDLAHDVRRQIVTAMQRLAGKTNSFPSYFFIHRPISLDNEYAVSSGSFGDIYKATLNNETLCLKVLRANQTILQKLAKSFAREAILWSQLSHPGVLPFYGLYVFRSQLSFVSPWAENGCVMDFLSQHKIGIDRNLLCLDTAMGIDYLHARGVIHGDIKSANVLVDRSGRAYLADFGLSNIDDPQIVHWTSQSSVASKGGSVRWQAPELHRAESDDDFDPEKSPTVHNTEKSDIFAWGCLCYEIFTNRVPFYHIRLPTTVMLRILEGQIPLRPKAEDPVWLENGLTKSIWHLLEECWKSDPAVRPDMSTIVSRLSLEIPHDPRPVPQWPAGSAMRFRKKESLDPAGDPMHPSEDLDGILSRLTGLQV
ncbi:hypothetical protein C0991_001257 [Blastosporella zonata]|nr:hypothetical protein C0991_001257 [Blastosporella zonata]